MLLESFDGTYKMISTEPVKVCQTGKYHAACSKKCEDTLISMQKEQPHIHSLAAYGIIIGDDTPVRRKELQNVF
jgi:hypothetical protein